jgi:hypothetical protein
MAEGRGEGGREGGVQVEHGVHVDHCKSGAVAIDSHGLRPALEDVLALLGDAWQAAARE